MTFIFVYKVILKIKKKRKSDKNGSMIQMGVYVKNTNILWIYRKHYFQQKPNRGIERGSTEKRKIAQNFQSDCLNMELKSLPYLFHILDKKHYLSKSNILFFFSLIEVKFK